MMAPSLSSKILLSSGSKVLRSPKGLYCRCMMSQHQMLQLVQ